MYYSAIYESPVGELTLCSDGESILGLWLEGQKYHGGTIPETMVPGDVGVFGEAREWLDDYFAGKQPAISRLPLAPIGSEFRQIVWRILTEIPYGAVTTYGEIGKQVARELGKDHMASLAVGGAVGHNPVSIIIPCHRVVGSDGSLTGYAGGLKKKIWLLEHEGLDMAKLYVPKKGTAL